MQLKGLAKFFELGSMEFLAKASDLAAHGEAHALAFAPPAEVWGFLLLRAADFDKAARLFQKVEKRYPNKTLAVLGLARALAYGGDCEAAAVQYARLQSMVANRSDADAFWVAEVRNFTIDGCRASPHPTLSGAATQSPTQHRPDARTHGKGEEEAASTLYPVWGYTFLIAFFLVVLYLLRRQWLKHPSVPYVRAAHLHENIL